MKDLTKKKLGQFSRALKTAQAAFYAEVEQLAAQARVELLPYFEQHGLDFMTGNGTWLITRVDRERGRPADAYEVTVEDSELPEHIRALLMLEVAHADHLGFYVGDITRGEV